MMNLMKRFIIALVSLCAVVAISSGCAAADGPSGLTMQDPKPLQEKLEGTHTVFFQDDQQLPCYGLPAAPNREGRFTCDWTKIQHPENLTLSPDDNPNIVFGYYGLDGNIVPCVTYENREIEWVSCGFGAIKR